MRGRRSPLTFTLAFLASVVGGMPAFVPAAVAGGGERFVMAWPPTRYSSAELILWLDDAAMGARVHVVGRGIDSVVDLFKKK